MEYFYASPESISRNRVSIGVEEFNHLVHVMRRKVGDAIRVVDGEGTAYDVTLTEIKKKMAVGRIDGVMRDWNEPSFNVTVGVGVLKNPGKFDFLVEKTTELGVRRIIPMITERTLPHHTKVERWRKLALAAMKQCGRSRLPAVEELQALSRVLHSVGSFDGAVVCHASAARGRTIHHTLQGLSKRENTSVLILIGPEGGFSDEEHSNCQAAGCASVSLGTRRLRTETAAILSTALVLQY